MRPPESLLSAIADLLSAAGWSGLGWEMARDEGFWLAEPCTLITCCWSGEVCGVLDGNCCPKCSWGWCEGRFCCGCADDMCCCCACEAGGKEWCCWGVCDLGWIDGEFICSLSDGGGRGGFPCAPDDNHGWLRDCIFGAEEAGEPTDETLKRLWPWKFCAAENN